MLTQLPTILMDEENEAYKKEAGQYNIDDIIVKQHNAAVRTIAVGHIVEKVSFFKCIYTFTENAQRSLFNLIRLLLPINVSALQR